MNRSTAQRRFVMLLLAGFAAVAPLLAAIGIYGTVSQAVAQRTAEIGLRMALGASPSSALLLVLGDGLWLVLVGMGTGLGASLFLTQLMRSCCSVCARSIRRRLPPPRSCWPRSRYWPVTSPPAAPPASTR